MTSKIFQEDIAEVAASPEIRWENMKGAYVLITGATGLIGTSLVHTLSAANKAHALEMLTIAHGRDTTKGERLSQDCGSEFISGDIRKPIPKEILPSTIDYIFHCAAITKSAHMVAKPVDVITTAVDGTGNILELAKTKHCKSLVYLSSMEVYGQTDLTEVTETDLGYLDLSNPRSSYPESKRLCESLCVSYAAQYDIPVKIARLAQTFGSGTPYGDTRVFAQFARSAISGSNIELHTEGRSRGNFCCTSDAIRGLLLLLLEGAPGVAYNIANPAASMTIREMAELVAHDVCCGKIDVVVNVPEDILKYGYSPDAGYTLNIDKLRALNWEPKYSLADMFKRVISDWQDSK